MSKSELGSNISAFTGRGPKREVKDDKPRSRTKGIPMYEEDWDRFLNFHFHQQSIGLSTSKRESFNILLDLWEEKNGKLKERPDKIKEIERERSEKRSGKKR